MAVATETCYVYLRLPKGMADGRPALPEDTSPPHITMLYVGKVSRPVYWRIVERISETSWLSLGRDQRPMIYVESAVRFFEHSPTEKDPYTDIAYAPAMLGGGGGGGGDVDLKSIHLDLRELLRPDIIKKIQHVSDGFNPHVTLGYLYGKQRTNKRVQAKLAKLADAVSGLWPLEMFHVAWGDVHRVAITLSGIVYQER